MVSNERRKNPEKTQIHVCQIEFKALIRRMLNKLGGKWMNSKNFNKELENML